MLGAILVKELKRVNMVKVLMIMHHIALCTICIALCNCVHLLHIRVDHVESKT
jgi:hypothetical protein